MFKCKSYRFQWKDLGNIEEGRPNLGNLMNVAVYRLMQYTLRDVLNRNLSVERSSEILREAGKLAGTEFCSNVLDSSLPFNMFVAELQEKMQFLKIGILRVEESNFEKMEFILTVAEDLDCSGLPPADETVCEYDEGFIAGILEAYTGRVFNVREIDCWASGERTCRFKAMASE
jgi:predicted hydrocarbon binding protein